MTTFSIEISDQKQARALFSFLKTLDSVKVSKISSKKDDSSLSQEMKNELDRRIESLGKQKTYKAKDALEYARKRLRQKH